MWIIEAVGGLSRADLLSDPRPLEDTVAERVAALAARRARGEPLQYVIGRAPFRHLELTVGPGVFIPRPETELVAERAMQLLPPGGTAVDVGTGSGAIALSIATERPDAVVLGTEESEEALGYAMRNAAEVGAAVELFRGDLLDALPTRWQGSVDVCVSNPPYVPVGERAALPRDVAEHEPHGALFALEGGLATIRRLAASARVWLSPGAWLVLEVGDGQGARVEALLRAMSYRETSSSLDLSGRERIVQARR